MLTRRGLLKTAAALGISTVLPSQAESVPLTSPATRQRELLLPPDRIAHAHHRPSDNVARLAADLMVIEAWEDLMDDLDCMELAARYTTLGPIERDENFGEARKGPCPICGSPAFLVGDSGYFCDAGCQDCGCGTTIELFARLEGLRPVEAMQQLRHRLDSGSLQGLWQERELFWAIMRETARFYHQVLLEWPEGEPGRQWLREQGINRRTVDRFTLGFAPPADRELLQQYLIDRGFSLMDQVVAQPDTWICTSDITIPFVDGQGRCWGLVGCNKQDGHFLQCCDLSSMRRFSPRRYGRFLFPIPTWPQDVGRHDFVLLTDHLWDVVVLHQAGIEQAVHVGNISHRDAGRIQQSLSALSPRLILPYHESDIGGWLLFGLVADLGACLSRLELLPLPNGQTLADVLRAEGPAVLRARLDHTVRIKDLFVV
jgi:DNA primase